MDSVGVLDTEFTAVVMLRFFEEKCGGKIGADPGTGTGKLPDCIVHVSAEGLPAAVAVEERWKNSEGEGGAEEERVLAQGPEDHLADLPGDRMALWDL